ncbi:MAG: sigma-70 family RNA polymerase sigma factor [Trichodesmium sp. MO_231.B1]|nr:sigma-70 family RNA polymerase sigma factor [Trichodesmium sp. MO_231.B1]
MTQECISGKDQFDSEWENLLSPDGSDSFFLVFIRRSLKQFHLDRAYTEVDIINEVYSRGVKTLQKGETIKSFLGWIRAVAYNYIRELSREKSKLLQWEDYHLQKEKNFIEIQDEELQSKLELVSQALKELTPEEQKLLRYKIIEDWSWKKIQGLEEYKDFTLSALRKRKERIVKKLHLSYHSLESFNK